MSVKRAVIAAAMLFCPLQALAAGIPSQQEGAKLVGTGGLLAYQGCSVAISGDGNTAIVGGHFDNAFVGAAWIFTRSAGVWSQQGAKLVGSGAVGDCEQGISVALSADGNTALVGGYNDSLSAGAAWVFTRSAGVWSQQGPKLVGTGASGPAGQGYSVALSGDGNTALVGGYQDNGNLGATWVFTRAAGVWSQQGGKLVGSGLVSSSQQGYSVALSGDGNTALEGGPLDNFGFGAIWFFTRTAGVWTQQGPKRAGSAASGVALQGWSVGLSTDGNTAIVGGVNDNAAAGAAWIYARSAGVWNQQGPKLVGSGALGAANQGVSVSISGTGTTAVLGGYSDNGSAGAAWVFTFLAGAWTQRGAKLVGTGAADPAQQGCSVSLTKDGNTLIVGGTGDNSGAGAAWVFIDPAALDVPQGGATASFALAAPAPNPAARSSRVTFALPSGQDVRVTLLDVQGREVALLTDGFHEAGSHTVPLDVAKLREGIYFVRLRGSGVNLTRRIAVLR